jgi:hypothetical protein
MTKIWNVLPILLSFVAGFPAWGQNGESTKIHVTSKFYGVRVRPEPGIVNTNVEGTLTLSGTNEVAVTNTASDGSSSRTVNGGKVAFGTAQTAGDATGAWHIAGPHKLVQIIDTPQNRTIATVVVTGKTCSYKVVLQLKPGSTEYKIFSTTLNAWAYYSQARLSNVTCTIQ